MHLLEIVGLGGLVELGGPIQSVLKNVAVQSSKFWCEGLLVSRGGGGGTRLLDTVDDLLSVDNTGD